MSHRIQLMHEKFGMSSKDVPFSAEEKKFRVIAMREEIEEYENSNNYVDGEETRIMGLADELDAMVDLIVFAMGTVERQGMLPIFEEAFNLVMRANCQKEVGPNQKRGSFELDLVKPEGWVAPDLKPLVEKLLSSEKEMQPQFEQEEFKFNN